MRLKLNRKPPRNWRSEIGLDTCITDQKFTHLKSGEVDIFFTGYFLGDNGRRLAGEEILDMVIQHGPDLLQQLDGSFLIAANDRNGTAWCATDPTSSLALYYKSMDDTVVITDSLLDVPGQAEPDLRGILSFLNSGYCWGELTLLKGWNHLGPGKILKISTDGSSGIARYFPHESSPVPGFDSPEEFIEELDKSLSVIAANWGRILLPLSGGVDSRLIAIRCHKLGIPFEAITFVAEDRNGDDFDIARRLTEVLGVRHHRWDWRAGPETVENFRHLILSSGGMNDAYTSYPDGMAGLKSATSDFDCIMRGDEIFGWGPTSVSPDEALHLLNIYPLDNLDSVLKGGPETAAHLLTAYADCRLEARGLTVDMWKNEFYRTTRVPRFIMPVARWQGRHTQVAYPFLLKSFIARMTQADPRLRSDKFIARQALRECSNGEMKSIPFSLAPTWKRNEPLFSLPPRILEEMIEEILAPSELDSFIDTRIAVDRFKASLERSPAWLLWLRDSTSLQLKKHLPASLRELLKKKKPAPVLVSSYLVFKRLFALKVFFREISSREKKTPGEIGLRSSLRCDLA